MAELKTGVEAAYDKYARRYDFALKLYGLIGLRIHEYRARAIALLDLKPGDHVVDLGCGTGLSFQQLAEHVGADGRITGVDISGEMLRCASERVRRAQLNNVELIRADIAAYEIPRDAKGVLSTGVFGYVSERDAVIERIARDLAIGRRVVIVDGKRPDAWPSWLFRAFVRVSRPFGLTQAYFDARTWESLKRWFPRTTFESVYGGLLYIACGWKPIRIA